MDKLIFDRGLVPSRERAQALIMAGNVLINEIPAKKSGQLVDSEVKIRIIGQDHPYVGRGGVKLDHALKEFKIDVTGKTCIDVGASTGGFTDCLLQNGAAKVYAIDVGYNQLDWKLRNDPRVVVMEKRHINSVEVSECGGAEVVVVDVSFISLIKVFPYIDRIIGKGTIVIALIKPQFEVGRENIAKGGIVRDEVAREDSVIKVCHAAENIGWAKRGITTSPITGADGNVEFLAWFAK